MTTQTVKSYTRSKPQQKVVDPFQDLIEGNRRIRLARIATHKAVQRETLRRAAKPHEIALSRIVRALNKLIGSDG